MKALLDWIVFDWSLRIWITYKSLLSILFRIDCQLNSQSLNINSKWLSRVTHLISDTCVKCSKSGRIVNWFTQFRWDIIGRTCKMILNSFKRDLCIWRVLTKCLLNVGNLGINFHVQSYLLWHYFTHRIRKQLFALNQFVYVSTCDLEHWICACLSWAHKLTRWSIRIQSHARTILSNFQSTI